MRKKVLITIGIFTLIRVITASVLELGNDETYYWLYSQQLQWNYFDHPPLIALGIRLFTFNLALDNIELFVRLTSIVCCAFSSWFIYQTVKLIHSDKAGWWAVMLYNISFFTSVIAGILVMPDAPQMLCWTFALWMLTYVERSSKRYLPWLGFGVAVGLCTMSKVHGIFLWIGLGLYIMIARRQWLKLPQLYLSVLCTLIIVSPIFIWNYSYNFITWKFHSERVDLTEKIASKDSFFQETISQIVINNPISFILIVMALFAYIRKQISPSKILTIYNYIAIPMALLFVFISMFRDIWPHWSGPAYSTLIPLTAIFINENRYRYFIPAMMKAAVVAFMLFVIAWPVVTEYYPGTIKGESGEALGQGDFTLDKYGWKEAGDEFVTLYKEEVRRGRMPDDAPVVCSKWWGSHFEYYFCDEDTIPVIGLGDIDQLHQYAWLNQQRAHNLNMQQAYCILSSIELNEVPNIYYRYYERMDPIATIVVKRKGIAVQDFYVYRLSGWKHGALPVPVERKVGTYARQGI